MQSKCLVFVKAMRGSSRITLKLVPDCGDEAVSSSSTILASFRLDAGSSEAAEEDAGGGIEQVVRCWRENFRPEHACDQDILFSLRENCRILDLYALTDREPVTVVCRRNAVRAGGDPDGGEDGSVSSRELDKVRLLFVFVVFLFWLTYVLTIQLPVEETPARVSCKRRWRRGSRGEPTSAAGEQRSITAAATEHPEER